MERQKNDHNQATIFVDADAFVASVKEDDPNHSRAKMLFETLQAQPVRFITSNYVFSEVITVLSQRVSKAVAILYIDTMTSPDTPFEMIRADQAIEEKALHIFKKQTSKNTSYVDCTNIAFIRQLQADAIFSFNGIYKKNLIPLVEDLIGGEKHDEIKAQR